MQLLAPQSFTCAFLGDSTRDGQRKLHLEMQDVDLGLSYHICMDLNISSVKLHIWSLFWTKLNLIKYQ